MADGKLNLAVDGTTVTSADAKVLLQKALLERKPVESHVILERKKGSPKWQPAYRPKV